MCKPELQLVVLVVQLAQEVHKQVESELGLELEEVEEEEERKQEPERPVEMCKLEPLEQVSVVELSKPEVVVVGEHMIE